MNRGTVSSSGRGSISNVTNVKYRGGRDWSLSSLLFVWVYPIVKLGSTVRDKENELWLPEDLNPEVVQPLLKQALSKKGATLVQALNEIFGWKYYPLGLLKLVADTSAFGGPLALNLLVKYVEPTGEEGPSLWLGLTYIGLMLMSTLSQAVFTSQFWFRTNCIGLSARSALVSEMYEKSLFLGPGSAKEFTHGQIMNLTSTDIDRLLNFFPSFHELWSLPIQILVGTCLLYKELGVATFAALFFSVLLTPINRIIAVRIGRLSVKLMEKKDQRVALTSELLHNAYFIKLKTLEQSLIQRIKSIRSEEMRYLSQRKYLDALCVYFWATTPVLMSLAIFAVYVWLGGELSSAQVFTSLALINLMLGPINSLPWVINGLVEANVSRIRIARFLDAEVLDPSNYFSCPIYDSSLSTRNNRKSTTTHLAQSPKPVREHDRFHHHKQHDDHQSTSNIPVRQVKTERSNENESIGHELVKETTPLGDDLELRIHKCSFAWGTFKDDGDLEDRNLEMNESAPLLCENGNAQHTKTKSDLSTNKDITLIDVSLTVRKGDIVFISGPVGSGKTSLMKAILGEMVKIQSPEPCTNIRTYATRLENTNTYTSTSNKSPLYPHSGTDNHNKLGSGIYLPSLGGSYEPGAGYGYASQIPFIRRGSVLDNVVFGRKWDGKKYMQVLYECDLIADLTELDAKGCTNARNGKTRDAQIDTGSTSTVYLGIKVFVGEHGSHLSGGQKARVALARALYGSHSMYILDDPLAALDSVVAQNIVTRCLSGSLLKKTVIFVSHNPSILRNDVVDATRLVSYSMNFGRLSKSETGYKGRESVGMSEPEDVRSVNQIDYVSSTAISTRIQTDIPSSTESTSDNDSTTAESMKRLSQSDIEDDRSEELLEKCELGELHRSVYQLYILEMGPCLAFAVVMAMIGMQVTRQLTDWWLGHWAAAPDAAEKTALYMRMYLYLVAGNSLLTALRSFLFAWAGLIVASRLHDSLLNSVVNGTLTYLTSTSIGRVLNRFGSDTYDIDDALPFILNIFLANLSGFLGMATVIVIVMPPVGLLLIPVAIMYYKIQCAYREVSREIKRLETITRSPIYSEFSDSLDGADTIRALKVTKKCVRNQLQNVMRNQRAIYTGTALAQWLTLNLQLLGIIFVAAVSTIAVVLRDTTGLHKGMVGLSLTYTLALINGIGNVMTSFTQTEIQMIAVERVKQYVTDIPQEGQQVTINTNGKVTSLRTPPPGWPRKGVIEFRNVSIEYSQGSVSSMPPAANSAQSDTNVTKALNGVSFLVKDGQRVGVCGRTGAGKSSLIAATFRLVECSHGQILVDDIDISTIPLNILRGRMGIITQTSVLFSGTIRENLDPYNICQSDEILIAALQRSHIWEKLQPQGIETRVDAASFSAGEKQLICIAAGIVNDAKIWWIDEATASLDTAMDAIVQEVIRDVFKGKTVITIAHRFATIADSDEIFTMERGILVERRVPFNVANPTN
eukprot:CFRG5323T1